MIGALKPYPEYEDSNLPWLGKVPANWQVSRAKLILKEIDTRSTKGQETLLSVSQYTGVTPRRTRENSAEQDTRSESLLGYKVTVQPEIAGNLLPSRLVGYLC